MKIRSRRGSITIEATIALTAFIFMFMMVYSVITITRAEAKIGVAINNVAKEISQYSYIYGLTGLNDSEAAIHKAGAQAKKDINDTVENVASTFDAIQTLRSDGKEIYDSVSSDEENILNGTMFDLGTWESLQTELDQVEEHIKTLVDDTEAILEAGKDVKRNLENMAENPKDLMFGLANIMIGKTLDVAKSRLIAEPVARALVKKNLLRTPTDNVEDCLKALGVVPGKSFTGDLSYIHGIDFSSSLLYPDGTEDIIIIAKYKLKLFRYLPIDIEFDITQVAATVGWFNGDKNDDEKLSKEIKKKIPTDTDADNEGDESDRLTEKEIEELLLALNSKYGEDIDRIYEDFGVEALLLINEYGEDAYLLISIYGGGSIRVIRDYGQSGLDAFLECEEDHFELLEMINQYGQNAIDIVNKHKNEGLSVLYTYQDDIADLDDVARERFVETIIEKSKTSGIKPVDIVLAKNDISTEEFNQLKLKDITDLSEDEKEILKRIRENISHPDEDTLMQKVVNMKDFDDFFSNKYTSVGGYITRAGDVEGIENYDELYESLRLDYTTEEGNKMFDPDKDDYMGVIKFKTKEVDMINIPYGKAMGGNIENPEDDNPFTGNGFTAARNGEVIPEYTCSAYMAIEDGAELYKVYRNGKEPELVARFNADLQEFIPVN